MTQAFRCPGPLSRSAALLLARNQRNEDTSEEKRRRKKTEERRRGRGHVTYYHLEPNARARP
jgi:hypothetical protein